MITTYEKLYKAELEENRLLRLVIEDLRKDLRIHMEDTTPYVGACPACGAEPGCNIDCSLCLANDELTPTEQPPKELG